MNALSVLLIGLGVWLIIDGVLSIIKYPRQTFPEQFIRIVRATAGIVIILIAIAEN